ncbi:MAG: hypothetical protein J4O04_06860 [Chloroflexi bacterium]|nr:hypothetical protein [Chloroflexota bacterium]
MAKAIGVNSGVTNDAQEKLLERQHMDDVNVVERFKRERSQSEDQPLSWHIRYYEAERKAARSGQAHFEYRFQVEQGDLRREEDIG